MQLVYHAIGNGYSTYSEILKETGLKPGAVRSALTNLTFVSMIEKDTDIQGRRIYILPEALKKSSGWSNASSVFAFTSSYNRLTP
jgi:hypothetical protein